ncbi:ExbD/TolR family protein [Zymomonas sp.]|uniref:ExbD/TolR family protein n=1 Tax=Zymomonas sp. TaxID=2068624 RepID=UPI0025D153F0|nr:ExbD/TolR family protein [Zymomonas sp.]MCA1955446.1 ExbD/TolR family protein [Zymomonas sp.]
MSAVSARKRRGAKRRPLMAEINVTPLVDVMLVLLIIFMVTAPLMVTGVAVNLPDSRAKALESKEKPVTITIEADGSIHIDDDVVDMAELPARLQAIHEANLAKHEQVSGEGDPDAPAVVSEQPIYLKADRVLNYGRVMQVMGELDHAGLKKVALVTTGSSGNSAASKESSNDEGR